MSGLARHEELGLTARTKDSQVTKYSILITLLSQRPLTLRDKETLGQNLNMAVIQKVQVNEEETSVTNGALELSIKSWLQIGTL